MPGFQVNAAIEAGEVANHKWLLGYDIRVAIRLTLSYIFGSPKKLTVESVGEEVFGRVFSRELHVVIEHNNDTSNLPRIKHRVGGLNLTSEVSYTTLTDFELHLAA